LVTTAEETSAIQTYLLTKGLAAFVAWIDSTDAATDGVWLAESGEELPYVGFTEVEPNGGMTENCLGVTVDGALDFNCDGNRDIQYTLCEM